MSSSLIAITTFIFASIFTNQSAIAILSLQQTRFLYSRDKVTATTLTYILYVNVTFHNKLLQLIGRRFCC